MWPKLVIQSRVTILFIDLFYPFSRNQYPFGAKRRLVVRRSFAKIKHYETSSSKRKHYPYYPVCSLSSSWRFQNLAVRQEYFRKASLHLVGYPFVYCLVLVCRNGHVCRLPATAGFERG